MEFFGINLSEIKDVSTSLDRDIANLQRLSTELKALFLKDGEHVCSIVYGENYKKQYIQITNYFTKLCVLCSGDLVSKYAEYKNTLNDKKENLSKPVKKENLISVVKKIENEEIQCLKDIESTEVIIQEILNLIEAINNFFIAKFKLFSEQLKKENLQNFANIFNHLESVFLNCACRDLRELRILSTKLGKEHDEHIKKYRNVS